MSKEKPSKNVFMLVYCIVLFSLFLIYTFFYMLFKPLFFLNNNQILYFFSASTQVIAGLFGLSMAGYVFLNNSLNKEIIDDPSKKDSIDYLKNSYFRDIVFMGILAIITIVACVLNIIMHNFNSRLYEWFMNITMILFFVEVSIIITFAIIIIEPNKLKKASARLKHEIEKKYDGNNKEVGDLRQFIIDYNSLEMLIKSYITSNQNKFEIQANINIPNSRLAYLLYENEIINRNVLYQLLMIIKYRNSLIHSEEVNIEKSMYALLKSVKSKIEKALEQQQILDDIITNVDSFDVKANYNEFFSHDFSQSQLKQIINNITDMELLRKIIEKGTKEPNLISKELLLYSIDKLTKNNAELRKLLEYFIRIKIPNHEQFNHAIMLLAKNNQKELEKLLIQLYAYDEAIFHYYYYEKEILTNKNCIKRLEETLHL